MNTIGNPVPSRSRPLGAVIAVVALLLAAGIVLFFHRMFPPEPLAVAMPPVSDYDSGPMTAAVDPTGVRGETDRVLALGSRFIGQEGAHALEETIRKRYRAAGLEVYEQENYVAAPRTLRREIVGADGKPLADVQVYPFMPNNLQPMNTPVEGLAGKLIAIDDEVLLTRKRFAGCIGLIDARDDRVPRELGFMWTRYARLGLEALIVAHPDGLAAMPWERLAGGEECMVSTLPVNYVRLAATPGIFAHVGEDVVLHVRTEYAETRHNTVVGVMRAPHGDGKSALILACNYDACSVLPDLAPGGMQALGPALHLRALEGLLSYRDQLVRDVIFVSFGAQSMGHDGKYNLLRILGPNRAVSAERENPVLKALGMGDKVETGGDEAAKSTVDRIAENDRVSAELDDIAAVLAIPEALRSAAPTATALTTLDNDTRDLFDEQIAYVLNALILELSEPALQTKITFAKLADGDMNSREFRAYQAAKTEYEEAMSVAGLGLGQMLATKRDFLHRYAVVDRWHARFAALRDFHQRRQRQLAQDMALIDLLSAYDEKFFFHPFLAPAYRGEASATEAFSFLAGAETDTQPQTFTELCTWAQQRCGLTDEQLTVQPYERGHEGDNTAQLQGAPCLFVNAVAMLAGYSCYAPITRNRRQAYQRYAYPVTLPFMLDTQSLRYSLRLTGELMLTLALGSNYGEFPGRPGRISGDWSSANLGGHVLVANVGQSMVPNFPLAGALVSGARNPSRPVRAGYREHPFYIADPYGRYELPYHVFGFASTWGAAAYSPVAVGFGKDGTIAFMKDEGPSGQRLFKSTGIVSWVKEIYENVTIVTFRATPVTMLDLLNPQTMREYSGVQLIDRQGLSALPKICRFPFAGVAEGIQTTFVPPEDRLYIELLSGTAENPFANEIRAFMLNVNGDFVPDPDREIDGAGYLAQDNPYIYRVPFATARSMAFLNGKRLALQERHHMADERTKAYHDKSAALIAESESGDLPFVEAARKARESVTYATLNHPVLRESIFEAVLGILWYLGLLVPFVFFFEKLVFGFTDIRKQLTAQAAAFIVVFLLLYILHPAFAMVRSSLMILLGFVIMIISGGVALLSSGKFHENLEELRKQSGKVKAAETNAMSAIGSAFMLGLNNMHRRKLRTGLTCATLVLMTFVMICFTSVQSDLVDKQITLGKAMYQGFLVKQERFRGMTSGEVYAVSEEYGHVYDVCPRTFLVGQPDYEGFYRNPEIDVVYETPGGVAKRIELKSALTFNDRDPVRRAIRFRSRPTWFTAADCLTTDTPPPVMISGAAADALGIAPAALDAGNVSIEINSERYPVKAVFDAESLETLQDLDGQDLLPFDINGLDTVNVDRSVGHVLADADAPRIPASEVLIFPDGRLPTSLEGKYSKLVIASTAVAMPKLSYRGAKEEINAYMERSARSVYYGLDGMAYLGQRTRETTMAGLIDMIIPLVIAALVVLNTIRGSVYERRDEIYVYNAVGIAPRYVFFMFFAEAIVYAVVGAVLGYLMSQGVGRLLTVLDMTGGMNMTFTSLTTIYASLAIAAATFISTYFPARTAMEIASPAEDAGWRLPEPAGDTLSFDLPFTFTHHDRIAVLSFFHRYLQDHGEGSAGRFFASPPHIEVGNELDALAEDAYIPQVRSTIWLKPYDLSVSQELLISMPTDADTGEFVAHIALVRLSGTREAWMRLNQGFVAQLRKHFLHWRAVSDQDRAEMFVEAKELMMATVGAP